MRLGVLGFVLFSCVALAFAAPASHAAFGFREPVAVSADGNPPTSAADIPALAMSDWGTAIVAWESTNSDDSVDILCARSIDYGASWTAPAPLSLLADDGTANNHAPSIATDGAGNWIAAWVAWTEFQFAVRYTITFAVSTDDGETWSEPTAVDSVTLPRPDALWSTVTPFIATDRAGNWMLAWDGLDPAAQPPNDTDIVATRSQDMGTTWDTPSLVHPSGNFVFDTTPRLLALGGSRWIAIWRTASNAIANAHFTTATSTDGGRTWSAPATIPAIGGDYAFLTGAAADRKGTIVISAYQVGLFGAATKIQTVRSADGGVTWEAPDRLNPDAKASTDAMRPAIATDRSGNWLALWWSKNGPDSQIHASSSADNGATWSAPALLDDTAFAERPVLGRPCLAASVTGRWAAVWPNTKLVAKSTYELGSLYAATSGFTEHDDLFLLAPSSVDTLSPESTVAIRWFSTGAPGAHVRIDLLRDAVYASTIAASTENDGMYNWLVPKKLRGKGYKVRIVSIENPSCSDRSDRRFAVRATP